MGCRSASMQATEGKAFSDKESSLQSLARVLQQVCASSSQTNKIRGGGATDMSIQKKSLISALKTTKKANVASSTEGVKNEGLKNVGMKAHGYKSTGLKSTGLKSTGLKMHGFKSTGLKSTGLKSTGLKSTGLKSTGLKGIVK
jgi:hypothetical protein